MVKYPNINDTNFYEKINTIYKKYKIPKKKQSLKSFCMPKEYTLQLVTELAAPYISQNFRDFKFWHTNGWINYNSPGIHIQIWLFCCILMCSCCKDMNFF